MLKYHCKNAYYDKSVQEFMDSLGIKEKVCVNCSGTYYPHRTATKESWNKQRFCSSICFANFNVKKPESIFN